MEKRRNSRTSNLKSATTKAKATVKSTVEKIEKTPAAEKTVKAVKKATETVAAKAPEVVEEVKNNCKKYIRSAASHLKFLRHPSQLPTLRQLLERCRSKGPERQRAPHLCKCRERAAYYTADGEGSDDYRIDLTTL